MPPTDPLRNFGVRQTRTVENCACGRENADGMDLVVFDSKDPSWVTAVRPLVKGDGDVWYGASPKLAGGHAVRDPRIRSEGQNHDFDPARNLIDPYARGLARSSTGRVALLRPG